MHTQFSFIWIGVCCGLVNIFQKNYKKGNYMNEKYLKKENEEDLDYAMRLISIKKNEHPEDLDWSDIVELLGLDLNKDSLRKANDTDFGGLAVYNKMKERIIDKEPIDYQNSIRSELQELRKERMKISDERAALNRQLRSQARKESLCEIAKKCADSIAKSRPVDIPPVSVNESDKVGLLTLGDIHFGLVINEFNNCYNSEICWQRLVKLAFKVIDILKLYNINHLYILGIGDYLSGIIHTITRIDNRESMIEQVMQFSDLLSSFLDILLGEGIFIEYYDVIDNHGRIFEKKDIASNKDNFSLLIKWFLQERYKDVPNIKILDNEIDASIGTVEIFNKNYCFVHGHKDKISNVVQNLSLMTKKFYEAVFIGHCHHFEANEVHGTYIYMNGTFAGTDEYANNLRVTSNPSQNLFIIDEDGINSQHLIKL